MIQERHFHDAHYQCTKPECLAEKFVVFGSEMDFKAHMLERHGAQMSAKDVKDARRIAVQFDSIDVDRGRGVSGSRGRGRGRGGSYRDAPPHVAEPPQNMSRGSRREGFGAALTTGDNAPSESVFPPLAQNGRSSPTTNGIDPETARCAILVYDIVMRLLMRTKEDMLISCVEW